MKQLVTPVNNSDHISGNINASLELVEYGDYECPHCGRAYPIVKDIQQRLGPDMKFVFRNFPLSQIHPHAFSAAVAAEAAALQDRFWEMHDLIFENQKNLEPENVLRLASIAGLNLEQFINDIQRQTLHEKVRWDFESGIRSGVNGTPTFFVNGKKFNGNWSENELFKTLKSELASDAFSTK